MPKFFLLAVFVLGLFVGYVYFTNRSQFELKSPVSNVLGKTTEPKLINSWFPDLKFLSKDQNSLNISAKSALLLDYDTGEPLYVKDSQIKLPAASTIKIMTALITLEKTNLDNIFTVSKKAAEIGDDTMGLTEGEKVRVEDLLYGLMLPSGNDAAITLAENVSGSEDNFVVEMNKMSKSLGMEDTKFINASGLDVDGEVQYTTSYDLAILAHYVWENFPEFRKITSTDHIYIDATDNHKAFDLYNETNLLTSYPGVKGIKPGFTYEAGLCLVTYAENDGKKLLGVILGSDDRRGEMKELLDFGFNKLGVKVEHPLL